jgi:hypothetical protein
MSPSQILLYALLLVLIYIIYKYLFQTSSNKITSMLPAGTPYVVSEDTISILNGSNPVFNYTVSIWIYIDNWDVTATPKPVLNIANALDLSLGAADNNLIVDVFPYLNRSSSSTSPFTMDSYTNLSGSESEPEPYDAFTSRDKKLKDRIKEPFYGKVSTSAITKKASGKEQFTTAPSTNTATKDLLKPIPFADSIEMFRTVVPAMPLQSWTNITVGIHDKALDIYINGKLTQSNLIPFVSGPVNKSITLTPSPGFKGWTSNFQYYPYNLTPAKIDSIYKGGYTGSPGSLLSLLGKYSVKLVFVDNTQQQS